MENFSFPITVFEIKNEKENILLIMEEVYGFPLRTSFSGGYDARGSLSISLDGYRSESSLYFSTGEIYKFFSELKVCYRELSGKAVLQNFENAFELEIEIMPNGGAVCTGWSKARADRKNILQFELICDQTGLFPVVNQLNNIKKLFGNERGIKDSLKNKRAKGYNR